jgi:adenylosuccinate lyase
MIPRYTRPEMAALWSDEARLRRWLRVELAHLRALEQLGRAPAGGADHVEAHARLDPAEVDAIEQTTRHDVIAFLTAVERSAGEPARLLHRGLTSSDVLDTALALALLQAGRMLLAGLADLTRTALQLAGAHRDTPCMGRTHGIYAEPTTFGAVLASHAAEFARAHAGLRLAVANVAVGKLAGAVGTYACTPPEAEVMALASLDLRCETAPTQVVPRDRHAAYFHALAAAAAAVERLAVNVRGLHRSEVGEVQEAFGAGQKGSSAMPHKRNPILAENLCGLARLVRGYARTADEDVALWHERDISHSAVERVIAPDATATLDFLLHRARNLLEWLEIDADQMLRHVRDAGGAWASGAVLNALVDAGLLRQTAYERVQVAALDAAAGRGPLLDRLAAMPDVVARLGGENLALCFDLGHALRHSGEVVDRTRAFALHELAQPFP